MKVARRRFLRQTAALGAVGLPFAALTRRARAQGLGALVTDPDGILDLPQGFSYRILQRRGDVMSDGYRAPGKMDGMGCFEGPDDTLVILRNQELNASHADIERPFPSGTPPPPNTYDPAEPGGVVRLVLDRDTLEIRRSHLLLYGTTMNCAGGSSPWGWLSCEEIPTLQETGGNTKHGYVFLCRPELEELSPPEPIPGYGRFRHEAAVVNAETYICYLTEDRGDSCFYRFVPRSRETPFEGVLQALKVVGERGFETSSRSSTGMMLDIEWVTIDDPLAQTQTVRAQAHAQGAALFVRGEGIAEYQGQVYICATTAGPASAGQIFRYTEDERSSRLDPTGGGTLELLVQSENPDVLNQPDNIIVAPWGDVYMCEDNFAGNQALRVLSTDGVVHEFGRNRLSTLEFAGICFSPDGKAMFVNLQHDGLMLAVTGPFRELAVQPMQDDSDLPDAGAPNDASQADAGASMDARPGACPPNDDGQDLLDVQFPQGLQLRGGCSVTGKPKDEAAGVGTLVAVGVAAAARRVRHTPTEDK